MKRIVTTLCALAVIMVGSIPAMAAEEPPRQDASYYPISVDEYTYGELEEPRINKVYQLSLSDDPSLIPTEDFERDGLWFTLLDMTRKNEVGVDTQPYTETVTRPSKTNDMAQVLQALEAEMEVTTAEATPAPCTWTTPASRSRRTATPPRPTTSPPPVATPISRMQMYPSSPRASRTRARPSPWLMSSGARRSIQTARAAP